VGEGWRGAGERCDLGRVAAAAWTGRKNDQSGNVRVNSFVNLWMKSSKGVPR
jgi:hypothetical protein